MGERRQGSSRMRAKARELDEARTFQVPASCDVAIVGGGASGLAAAIVAAEAGASAVVLEQDLVCGRKILATGNGRCNFAAADLAPSAYSCPDFVAPVLGAHPADEVLAFFLECGLAWTQDETRLYPLSRQAASVRDVLLARADRAGVALACARGVQKVMPDGNGWTLAYAGEAGQGTLHASSVILAGGGSQAASLPPQLPQVAKEPILCPLAATGLPFSRLDGRRAHGKATLLRRGKTVAIEEGEFLFRSYGVSGIAAFNLSREAEPGDTLVLDLAPGYVASQLARLIGLAGSAAGVADPALAALISDLGGQDPKRMAELLKGLNCRIEGRADTAHAQVTRGGLATSAFSPETLEADPAQAGGHGLFACGEALDVDGPCGGYNLGWAWLSGVRAGEMAAACSRT